MAEAFWGHDDVEETSLPIALTRLAAWIAISATPVDLIEVDEHRLELGNPVGAVASDDVEPAPALVVVVPSVPSQESIARPACQSDLKVRMRAKSVHN